MPSNPTLSRQQQYSQHNSRGNLLIPKNKRQVSFNISGIILIIGIANVAFGIIGFELPKISSDPVTATRVNIWAGVFVSTKYQLIKMTKLVTNVILKINQSKLQINYFTVH